MRLSSIGRTGLVMALKEGAASSWPNGDDGGSEEEEEPSKAPILDPTNPDVKGKRPAPSKPSRSKPSWVQFISQFALATQAALQTMESPPPFEPLPLFLEHLDYEYGGFR